MSITLVSNIASLRATNALAKHRQALQVNYERLSSGVRINRPSDDPASLHLSQMLLADMRVASMAIRNANDGISFVSINEQALGEIVNILGRMAELAAQAANSAFVNTQRSGLHLEFQALGSEIQRISRTTTFNDINTLSSGQELVIQVGFNSFSSGRLQIGGITATLSALSLGAQGSEALSYSIISNSEDNSTRAAVTALAAITQAIEFANQKRGLLGASLNRLESAVSNLQVARENYVAAAGRIRDVDVAQELASMVKNLALQDAATAILAQANVQPKVALQLLRADNDKR